MIKDKVINNPYLLGVGVGVSDLIDPRSSLTK